jgi:flagellar hook assembly protein FlgD
VEQISSGIPTVFSLNQSYPNPFVALALNPETEIGFQLPKADHIVLRIFNTLGQEIRTLADDYYQPGNYRMRWDGKDRHGNTVPSGIYLYQLQAGTFSQVRKMSLLR